MHGLAIMRVKQHLINKELAGSTGGGQDFGDKLLRQSNWISSGKRR